MRHPITTPELFYNLPVVVTRKTMNEAGDLVSAIPTIINGRWTHQIIQAYNKSGDLVTEVKDTIIFPMGTDINQDTDYLTINGQNHRILKIYTSSIGSHMEVQFGAFNR